MNYFAVLMDKNFKSLSPDIYSQYPVRSMNLKRKSQDFDEMTISFKKMENSKNALYIGVFDQSGSLYYLAMCGIPVTKDKITTVNAVDIRRILNQEIYIPLSSFVNTSDATANSVRNYYQNLLEFIRSQIGSYLGIDFEIDTTSLATSFPYSTAYDMTKVSDGKDEIRNAWDLIQSWNLTLGITVLCEANLTPEENHKVIVIKALPVNMMLPFSLNDFDIDLSYSRINVNMSRAFSYDDKNIPKYEYHLLSNNDVVEHSHLSDVYTDSDTFGTFNGINQYRGKTKSTFMMYPGRCKDFLDSSKDTDSADDKIKNLAQAKANALAELAKARYQDSVTISLDNSLARITFDGLFYDSGGNGRESWYPFETMGKVNGYSNADSDHFKLLPVSEIDANYTSTGKLSRSIVFGYLSDYAWLKGI